jgi:hypothetical protein
MRPRAELLLELLDQLQVPWRPQEGHHKLHRICQDPIVAQVARAHERSAEMSVASRRPDSLKGLHTQEKVSVNPLGSANRRVAVGARDPLAHLRRADSWWYAFERVERLDSCPRRPQGVMVGLRQCECLRRRLHNSTRPLLRRERLPELHQKVASFGDVIRIEHQKQPRADSARRCARQTFADTAGRARVPNCFRRSLSRLGCEWPGTIDRQTSSDPSEEMSTVPVGEPATCPR